MDFIRENKTAFIIAYLVLWVIISLLTLLLYKIDKVKAQKHQWRIKEAVLLSFPWLLGSLGGILGVFALRHKTKHWYFVVNNILSLIVHIAILIVLIAI